MEDKHQEIDLEEEERKVNEERQQEEDELKKEKERQAFLDNIYVMVAMVVIVAGAIGIVVVKINFFGDEKKITFRPLNQRVGGGNGERCDLTMQVQSTIRYTGHGYIPCKGYAPTPAWCK